MAYEIWAQSDDYTWKGLSVFAIDGSKYDLPASSELRAVFDPTAAWITQAKAIIRNAWCQPPRMCFVVSRWRARYNRSLKQTSAKQ
ncbi:MAG: hypothetical protein ACRERU_15745 [Methylococcales bacterium]